ncbi:hypothetical protein [Chromobacterium violaceum]|nr:hypothetical protein [Chromobacterium violaceum]
MNTRKSLLALSLLAASALAHAGVGRPVRLLRLGGVPVKLYTHVYDTRG